MIEDCDRDDCDDCDDCDYALAVLDYDYDCDGKNPTIHSRTRCDCHLR